MNAIIQIQGDAILASEIVAITESSDNKNEFLVFIKDDPDNSFNYGFDTVSERRKAQAAAVQEWVNYINLMNAQPR